MDIDHKLMWKRRYGKMKTVKKVCLIAAGVVVVAGIVWGICGKKGKDAVHFPE